MNHDTLALAHSALVNILRIKVERVQALIVGMVEANGLVESFGALRAHLDTLNTRLVLENEALDSQSKTQAESATLLQEHEANIQIAQQERVNVEEALERMVNEAAARQQIAHRNQSLAEAANAVRSAEEQCSASREKHERNQQLRSQHTQLDNQLRSLEEAEKQLQEGQRIAIEWEAAEDRLEESHKELYLLQEGLARLGAELTEKRAVQEACKTAEGAARVHYQALSSSADAIRLAVASIAEHLTSEQERCPLCLYPHGADELQERVAQALQEINPSLASADQQLKVAVDALAASNAEVASKLEAVADCQSKIAALGDIRRGLEQQIIQYRVNPILASSSLPQAKESLRGQLDGVSANRKNLTGKLSSLEPLVAQETFEQVQRDFDFAVSALDQARVQYSEALTRRDQSVTTLSTLTTNAAVVGTLEELTLQKNQLDDRISALNGQVATVQSVLDAQRRQFHELSSAVRTTKEVLTHTHTQLESHRARWQGLGLEGDPLTEAAQARSSTLSSALADLESGLEGLENLGVEISAWAKLNESQLAQRLIDAQCLDRTEESFFADLNERIAIATRKYSDVSKLSEAMEALDSFLKKEIGNVQKHVRKVVPRWQALLKRVVRETRFHEASLNFFTHYNKEKAEVLVPLGSRSASVPDVASEAQLTDLQLTFLLAMAMSHQWSPWKALLLDDPTQHHDLVHASAVFDLLRDYIVDHGFQVVIATHDALQARYFLRKLQNDGIDAKIWTLVPTAQGVTAKEGPGGRHLGDRAIN